jgi:hypothetical protein
MALGKKPHHQALQHLALTYDDFIELSAKKSDEAALLFNFFIEHGNVDVHENILS